MKRNLSFKVFFLMALYTMQLILIISIKISKIYTILLLMLIFCANLYLILNCIDKIVKYENNRQVGRIKDMVASHTIFNFINTIAYLCRKDTDKARECLVHFSNYLRKCFKGENEFWDLDEEMSLIESYLFIQKIRFSDKLVVQYFLKNLTGKIRAYYIFDQIRSCLEMSYKENYKVFKLLVKPHNITIIRVDFKGFEENIDINFR